MKTRVLGISGLTTPAVGLGCLGFTSMYGKSDEAESIRTIHQAADLGVTLLDTSDVYGAGENEMLVGKAIKGRRQDYVVTTKFGVVPAVDGKPGRYDGSPTFIRESCDASLRRLGVDAIDLYLQHRIDPNVPVEESIGTLAELVSEGKVRFIGLSDTTPDVIRRANAVHPISVLQSEYSLVERGVEDEILGVCEELGVGFMAFSPLCRGLLTGQLVDTTVLDEGDVRKTNHFPRVGPDFLQTNAGMLEPLRDVADQRNCSQAQVALAWLLAQRPYVVPIPGARTVDELISNAAAVDVELSDSDLELLDGLATAITGERVRR
jgi:aryl-alcohol dehydrogenase-like predicted oxidoreductase